MEPLKDNGSASSKMKIFVTVRPGAKNQKIEPIAPDRLWVAVKEPPRDGRANEAVIRALAAHFGVAPSRVLLLKGASARNKVFEISS